MTTDAQIISTIRTGQRIVTDGQTYTVHGSMKTRSGYKYVVRDAAGRKLTLDREDVLEAQRDGSAKVLGA